jgi:type II secretory pathway pseudopilin PulG
MTRSPTPSSPARARRCRLRGYTLTEILVVIGLIVLLIAIAVPVLSVLSGSRSTEAAENQVAAMLNQARAQAIALQKNVGVCFFVDPASKRTTMALVLQEPAYPQIERLPDYDFVTLQSGTGLQLVHDDQTVAANVPVNQRDRYVRVGVIMFDGRGQAVSVGYQINVNSALAQAMDLQTLLNAMGAPNAAQYHPTEGLYTQLGLVIYDNETFSQRNFSPLDGRKQSDEFEECAWLDANAVPFVVNRYNGTLIRGE